jgi:hypothetical protein
LDFRFQEEEPNQLKVEAELSFTYLTFLNLMLILKIKQAKATFLVEANYHQSELALVWLMKASFFVLNHLVLGFSYHLKVVLTSMVVFQGT